MSKNPTQANKAPVPVLLTEGLRYDLRKKYLRNIPLFGDRLPIGSFLAHADERKKENKMTTDIDFLGNSALNLTADLHLLMLLAGGWESQIENLVKEVGNSLFNADGFYSAEALKTGQSSLGPKIAGNEWAVEGLNRGNRFPTVSELMAVFEMGGDDARTKHQKQIDILLSLAGGGTLAVLGEAGLALQGDIMKTVALVPNQQPWLTTSEVVGGLGVGAVSALAGAGIVRVGNYISRHLRDGEELPKIVQNLAPIITALIGLVGGKAIVEGLFQTTQVSMTSLESSLLHIPVLAGAIVGGLGVGALSNKVHEREQDAISAEIGRIKKTGRVNMLLSMANNMTVLQKLKKWGDGIELDNITGPRQERVTKALQDWDTEVTAALASYNPRHTESNATIRDLAPNTILKLSERLLIMDTLAAYIPPATMKTDEISANTVAVGIIPGPDKLFGNLDRATLTTLGGDTANFIKQLAAKSPISALSAFSPTLSLVMLGQGTDTKGGLGGGDDSKHYAFGGMNFGLRSDIVDMVSASLSKLGTVGDPGRAHMTAHMNDLGALYKKAVPIEGLELIYKEPAYARLAVMGSIAFSKAQETKTFQGDMSQLRSQEERLNKLLGLHNNTKKQNKIYRRDLDNVRSAIHTLKNGESTMGSKGLLSDVGDAIINGMNENPMVGYLVLADITNAIKMYSSEDMFPLLGPVDKGARKETLNALKSLREGIVGKILKKTIPQNQKDLAKFFTNTNYAIEAYMAITLCQETCTDYDNAGKVLYDATDALMKTTGLTLSPIFRLDDLQIDPKTGNSTNTIVNQERQLPTGRLNSGRIGELDDAMTGVLIDMIHLSKRHSESPTHRKLEELLHREFLPSMMVDYIRKISPGGNNGTYTPLMMKNTESFMPYAFRTIHSTEIPSLAIQLASILENFADTSMTRFGGVAPVQVGNIMVNEDYLRLISAIDIGHAVLNSRAEELGGVLPDSGGTLVLGQLSAPKAIPPNVATRIDRAIRAIETKFGKMLETANYVRSFVQQMPLAGIVGPS